MKALAIWLLAGLAASGQDFSHISIDKVDAGFRFTEGAVWSREGFLLFSDVPNNKIRKLTPGERSVVFREESHGANGNTFDVQGRLYTCESRTRRVVAKAEHLKKGSNPRFVVTSLPARSFPAPVLYETVYCARGEMENRIKEQLSLFADRVSAETMRANQLRLYFSAIAYVLVAGLR